MCTPRPGDRWRGIESVWCFQREAVHQFISTLRFESLRERADLVRFSVDGVQGAQIRTDNFSSGRDNLVFEISFPDDVLWIARISFPALPPPPGHTTQPRPGPREAYSECITMDYIRNKTSIPVPRIYELDPNSENDVGARYMFMDEIQGHPIEPVPTIPMAKVEHVYSQIADIVLQLSKLTFPKIGLLSLESGSEHTISDTIFEDFSFHKPFTSAAEFYTSRARRYFQQKCAELPINNDWAAFAWLILQAIPQFLVPEFDRGPFPLKHPDLNNLNISYNDNYDIVGVFDWTATQALPWQSFLVPPRGLDPCTFIERRTLYINIFEAKEKKETGDTCLSHFMRSRACEIVELVDDYHGWGNSFPKHAAIRLAELVFGINTKWEDVQRMYLEAPRS
jgi:isoamyl acetate esterase